MLIFVDSPPLVPEIKILNDYYTENHEAHDTIEAYNSAIMHLVYE
jgi:hypothetical protein